MAVPKKKQTPTPQDDKKNTNSQGQRDQGSQTQSQSQDQTQKNQQSVRSKSAAQDVVAKSFDPAAKKTTAATGSQTPSKFAPELENDGEKTEYSPGEPRWWLDRLCRSLMNRHAKFDILEDYASGNHPLPNGDKRYVKALKDLQKKSRTNYCELIIKATTQRMRVKGFRFGPEGEADEDAKRVWDSNEMDLQSVVLTNYAATYGVAYAMIEEQDEGSEDPYITFESPYQCIIERDPLRPTRTLAGLKLWQDNVVGCVMAVLMTPDNIYVFQGRRLAGLSERDLSQFSDRFRSNPLAAGLFEIVAVQPNSIGEVPLVEVRWQPEYGDYLRAEHEGVLDIQDRVNYTILSRIVATASQSYRQRWMTGANISKGPAPRTQNDQKAPFDPGADIVWAISDPTARFGDFEQADLTQMLECVRDDVGDMAAISQTPAGYLLNKMANISGDAMAQDQSALLSKIKHHRHPVMGWFYEKIMKICFLYLGDEEKAKSVEATTLWCQPEVRSVAEQADAFSKLCAAGVDIGIAAELVLDLTPDQIQVLIQKAEEAKQLELDQMVMQTQMNAEAGIAMSQSGPQKGADGSTKPGQPPNPAVPTAAAHQKSRAQQQKEKSAAKGVSGNDKAERARRGR